MCLTLKLSPALSLLERVFIAMKEFYSMNLQALGTHSPSIMPHQFGASLGFEAEKRHLMLKEN